MTGPGIHPTAVIDPAARLGEGVTIGAHSVIGERVEIGDQTVVGPQAVIQGPTVIGRNNHIFGQSSIGSDPQDLKYRGEESFLEIGDENLIREFVTINRGTAGGGGVTRLGSGNLLMTCVHVAHDCILGDGIILGNAVTFAGHVIIDDFVNIGAFSGVQQFCRVGCFAFVGGYSIVTRDALPFVKVVGERNQAKIFGINKIGLERRGVDKREIDELKAAYRVLFRSGLQLKEAVSQLREGSPGARVTCLLDFIDSSERGFIR